MTVSEVSAGDAHFCVQTFGRFTDPAVLLIGGATSSMDWWEADFCLRLADAERFVVRYDHRDTTARILGRRAARHPGAHGTLVAILASVEDR